ncbi:unnamed protein product, partial [Oppiella nova]
MIAISAAPVMGGHHGGRSYINIIKSVIAFISTVPIIYCQTADQNPTFLRVGPESPPKPVLYLASDSHSVPPLGTSDFVRHFARQTSGENAKNFGRLTETDGNIGATVVRRLPLIDGPDVEDPHHSHRNFVMANEHMYYAVRTPPAHEIQAPVVGHYHSSYEGRNKGKLYLG